MTTQLAHEATRAETTEPATPAGRGRLGEVCHRIRLTVQEMNYASRRLVELQAPWSVDDQRYRR
jgi:hypothetical protein